MDTGLHDFRISTRSGVLALQDTLTLTVFEADRDQAPGNELYVLSSQGCQGWLRVFRISKV